MPEHVKDVLEICDEYSHIDQSVWDAVEADRAGTSRRCQRGR